MRRRRVRGVRVRVDGSRLLRRSGRGVRASQPLRDDCSHEQEEWTAELEDAEAASEWAQQTVTRRRTLSEEAAVLSAERMHADAQQLEERRQARASEQARREVERRTVGRRPLSEAERDRASHRMYDDALKSAQRREAMVQAQNQRIRQMALMVPAHRPPPSPSHAAVGKHRPPPPRPAPS